MKRNFLFYLFSVIALTFLLIAVTGIVQAACLKSRHIMGTAGTDELCRMQYEFELKKQRDAIEAQQRQYDTQQAEAKAPKMENKGQQAGNAGTIVNLGPLGGGNPTEGASPSAGDDFGVTSHNVALEWSGYHFPQAPIERTMPDPVLMPTGLRYEWYFSKNFGFGLLYQQYVLTGWKNFDPITVEREVEETVTVINDQGQEVPATRKVKRQVPVRFPGAVDSMQYQRLMYFATFNTGIGIKGYHLAIRFGSGMARGKVKYRDIDLSKDENKYATQPGDTEYSADQPFFFDASIERWFQQTRVSATVRFVEADNATEDYLDYIRVGGTEIVISATFGLPSFGFVN
jgi:hypothetical protein